MSETVSKNELKSMRSERCEAQLRAINEDNFIDAFNLKLANGQERFVSHPMGHSTPTTTLNFYAHADKKSKN